MRLQILPGGELQFPRETRWPTRHRLWQGGMHVWSVRSLGRGVSCPFLADHRAGRLSGVLDLRDCEHAQGPSAVWRTKLAEQAGVCERDFDKVAYCGDLLVQSAHCRIGTPDVGDGWLLIGLEG